jgi:hypothetical protein
MYYTHCGSWLFVQGVQVGFEAQISGTAVGSIHYVLVKYT